MPRRPVDAAKTRRTPRRRLDRHNRAIRSRSSKRALYNFAPTETSASAGTRSRIASAPRARASTRVPRGPRRRRPSSTPRRATTASGGGPGARMSAGRASFSGGSRRRRRREASGARGDGVDAGPEETQFPRAGRVRGAGAQRVRESTRTPAPHVPRWDNAERRTFAAQKFRRRVAATPRLRRGYSVEASRGRRSRNMGIPQRRVAEAAVAT